MVHLVGLVVHSKPRPVSFLEVDNTEGVLEAEKMALGARNCG